MRGSRSAPAFVPVSRFLFFASCPLTLVPGYTGHNPRRRDGRVAEGGGLLNRYRVEKLYRGFESLSLRHPVNKAHLLQRQCRLDESLF